MLSARLWGWRPVHVAGAAGAALPLDGVEQVSAADLTAAVGDALSRWVRVPVGCGSVLRFIRHVRHNVTLSVIERFAIRHM
jgi:hypothetical protein